MKTKKKFIWFTFIFSLFPILLLFFQNSTTHYVNGSYIYEQLLRGIQYPDSLLKFEKSLPPLDSIQLTRWENKKIQNLDWYILNGYVYNKSLQGYFSTTSAFDPKHYEHIPFYKAPIPTNYDYVTPTGEFVDKNSNRKVVRRISAGYFTTRDNKLWSENGGIKLLQQNINPHSLQEVSGKYRYIFFSDLNNNLYSINSSDSSIKFMRSLPVQIEVPVITILVSGKHFRICSLNSNRDFYCTGTFGIKIKGNSIANYEPAVVAGSEKTYSTAYLISRNICGRLPNVIRKFGLSTADYLLLTCDKRILIEGSDIHASLNNYGDWTREDRYSNAAVLYSGVHKFSFVGPRNDLPPIPAILVPVAIPLGACSFSGGIVNNGSSVTAYQNAVVPYGSKCVSQARTCTNGVLSGSYTQSSCKVETPVCYFGGQVLNEGQSITTYLSNSVPSGSTCQNQIRVCSGGVLSGSYNYTTCVVGSGGGTIDGAPTRSSGADSY